MDVLDWISLMVIVLLFSIMAILGVREVRSHFRMKRYRQEDERFVESLPLKKSVRNVILEAVSRRYDFPMDSRDLRQIQDLRIGDLFSGEEKWALDRLISLESDGKEKDEVDLNARIQEWSKIPAIIEYASLLGGLTQTKHNRFLPDLDKEELIMKKTVAAMPVLERIRECCLSKEKSECASHEGSDASETPLLSHANRSFDSLLKGVSGMSHLRVPYVEMIELLENPDSDEEIQELSRRTLGEIEGLIERKREQERLEKIEREKKFIGDVRHAIGLQGETEKVI